MPEPDVDPGLWIPDGRCAVVDVLRAAKTAGYDYAYFGDGSEPEFIDDKLLAAGNLAQAMVSLFPGARSEWMGDVMGSGCVALSELGDDNWDRTPSWYVCTAEYANWLFQRHEVKSVIKRICR